ncbi:hypothetical protein Misp01_49340 [Microtetraspora sp. NBRC 13810]|uniref:GOLPH3/VPS74 family protein n=1 Tax=Microtetraspora sp. NBRC 13810 TaxID=3030990 RepID=UPI0024A18C5C|nr:GPP34 family phosphoprotein [Microtetraspora sp. NBRC 13810]GLW09805.1 hypothetical protein Misp01_49340 [Microtetraspora sp. NBRC 13810]
MDLNIAEELLLLAHTESDGRRLIDVTRLDLALGGALLAELAVRGRVELAGKQVAVLDRSPLGDEELDAALTMIAERGRAQKPEWWVNKLKSAKLRERLLGRLAAQGVLGEEHVKVLGLFPAVRYPERDGGYEREVRQRVQSALDGSDPDARISVLIAIMHACSLDRKAFPGADKKRVKEISQGEWAGQAVAKIISAVNAAVIAAMAGAAVAGASG